MSRKRQSRSADDYDEAPLPRRPRRVQRFKRRLVGLILLLLVVVAAAPTIVGQTALRNTLLGQAIPAGWTIESEQASLGWMSNQTIGGLKIADAEGKILLTVESVTLPKSLLSLAVSRADLGKIELLRPTAYVETRTGGSNWEDFIAALQSSPQDSSAAPVRLGAEVVEGVVRGADTVTGQQWLVDNANVTATVGETIEANGSAELATGHSDERGKLKFHWQPDKSSGQQLELLAERLPLSPLEPWLARVAPGTYLSGVLSTDARMNWHIDSQRGLILQSSGRLEANNLEVTTPALAGDRLRTRQVTMPWEVEIVGDDISVAQLRIDSDWAKLEARGSLSRLELQALNLEQLTTGQLPQREMQLAGEIDLAKLATMLPDTLQLREGVRIDAGQLAFQAGGEPKGDRFAWQVAASVENVAGSDGGREIRWQQPIEANVTFRETATGAQLENMTVNSPFANAKMRTQQDAVTGEFEVDLAKLSQELSQFVDMQSWQLRGLGEGNFSVARQPNQQFEATANLQLTDLRVADAAQQVWNEPKLEVSLSATGNEQDFAPTALTTGNIRLVGPRDQFEASLLEPVQLTGPQQQYQLRVEANGPLQLWSARLRPWLSSMPERLAGDAHIRARVQVAGNSVQVMESTGSVVQLNVQTDAFAIDEPRVEFAGDGAFDLTTASLQSRAMQVLGSSFSFRARDIDIATGGGGRPSARGTVAFRADLERISTMANLVGGATSTWPRGTAVGQLQLTSDAEQVQADFDMKVENLQLVRTTAVAGAAYGQPETVWAEPLLETAGIAKYTMANDRVQFEKLQVTGETLQVNGSASVDRVSTTGELQANGLIEYLPEQLAKLVASYAGQDVQLQGDRQVRFQIAGALFTKQGSPATHWSQSWDVTAEAGWSSAGAYGLPLGGGRLKASLLAGQLQIAPLDIAVGKGRLTAQPLVGLLPGNEKLILQRGPLVTNVEISPEVSEKMLKYVAPILAGATRTEGQFSIDLDQAEIPFSQPNQSRVQGRLMTHRLTVSPGPMMNQLIALVKQVESLSKRQQFLQTATQPRTKSFLTMVEQQVEFQVVEGRVYHRNLEFLIDNAPVRSYGSVGFDQTLALMIEVPIQDKWIEREPALRSLAGQSLKLPIYGTFQKPKIDERAVANLSAQMLQGAATQAIGDELNRQFDKLFRGK